MTEFQVSRFNGYAECRWLGVLTRARCVSSSLLLSCKASLGTKSLPVLGGKCLGRSLRTIGAKKLAFFVEHLFPSSTQQCLNV